MANILFHMVADKVAGMAADMADGMVADITADNFFLSFLAEQISWLTWTWTWWLIVSSKLYGFINSCLMKNTGPCLDLD